MVKTEYFKDTEYYNDKFFTIRECDRLKISQIDDWDYSEPLVQNEFFSIYNGNNWISDREGFIIKTENNILIIQVKKDTKTRSPVLHCLEESMEMYLLSGCLTYDFETGNKYDATEEIQIEVIHILLSNCLLVITYSDENDLKIFIDEFNHESDDDILNRRLSMKYDDDGGSVHASDSESESSDEYDNPYCNCSLITFTKVESLHDELENDNYIYSLLVYQIIQRGGASILVIKKYEIKFTHKHEQEKIYKKQIHFTIPQFPNLYFNDIDNIGYKDIYDIIITYKDSNDNDSFLNLRMVDNYSKTLEGVYSRPDNETFKNYYYIFSGISGKIQIYHNTYVPHVSSCKKLIGFIDFSTENDTFEDSPFEKQFTKLYLTRR
jgi:hypothetical protein